MNNDQVTELQDSEIEGQIIDLQDSEIAGVNGGFFWVALPVILAGGYTLGKDRALRDNARDAQSNP